MKTLVLEKMPDLFWQKIKKNNWQKYFITTKTVNNHNETEILIIRTNTIVDADLLDKLPGLKLIIRAGTGYDNIDFTAAQERNILATNTPEANVQAAFEHTIALLFALIKQVEIGKKSLKNNNWKINIPLALELNQLKVAVVGVGRIGTKVVRFLQNLKAEVVGVDPYLEESRWRKLHIKKMRYEQAIQWCNLLTFHCPLTRETENYFSKDTVDRLTEPIYLINTSRGKVVAEDALKIGLQQNKLLGAALDVFEKEPWEYRTFFNNYNVIVTPHQGAHSIKAKERMAFETLKIWENFVFNQQFNSKIDKRFIYR